MLVIAHNKAKHSKYYCVFLLVVSVAKERYKEIGVWHFNLRFCLSLCFGLLLKNFQIVVLIRYVINSTFCQQPQKPQIIGFNLRNTARINSYANYITYVNDLNQDWFSRNCKWLTTKYPKNKVFRKVVFWVFLNTRSLPDLYLILTIYSTTTTTILPGTFSQQVVFLQMAS